jgi:hypothetical protein
VQVFCYYDGTREVAPGYKRSKFEEKPFGVHMDVSALMARQARAPPLLRGCAATTLAALVCLCANVRTALLLEASMP